MARRNSNLKWEVVAWAPDVAAVNQSAIIPITVGNTSQTTLEVIGSTALEAHDREQLTLIRLVGGFRMCSTTAAGAAGSAACVKIRLHVGMEVAFDGAVVTTFADPWEATDAEEEFLWEDTYDVLGRSAGTEYLDWNPYVSGSANGSRGDNPFNTHIDVKIKRTVVPPQVLGLTFAAKGADGDSVRVWAWLRALVAV